MSLELTLSETRQLGGLNIIGQAADDAWLQTTPGQTLFPDGSNDDFIIVYQTTPRTRDPLRYEGNVVKSNEWVWGLASDDNRTVGISMREFNTDSQRLAVYFRDGGSISGFCEFTAAEIPRRKRSGYQIAIIKKGLDVTLAVSAQNTDVFPGYELAKDTVTLSTDMDLSDYNGVNGYACFGRPSATFAAMDGSMANWGMFVKDPDVAWSDIMIGDASLDTDAGLLRFINDPHAGGAAGDNASAWKSKLSFDILNGEGKQADKEYLDPAEHTIRCIHTGVTGTYNTNTPGTEFYTGAPHDQVWDQRKVSVALASYPTHIKHNNLYVGVEHLGLDASNRLVHGLVRRGLDNTPIAPAIILPGACLYEDSSDGDAVKTHYDTPLITMEVHEGASILKNRSGDKLMVVSGQHSNTVSNEPDTGDTSYATGWTTAIDDNGQAVYAAGTTAKSYTPLIDMPGDKFISHMRSGSTVGGKGVLILINSDGSNTEVDVTQTSYSSTTNSGYAINAVKLDESSVLCNWVVRTSEDAGNWGLFGIIVTDNNDGTYSYYAPRTGAHVTSELGSIEWDDSRFYFVPSDTQRALIEEDYDLTNLSYITTCRQLFSTEHNGETYIGANAVIKPVGDPYFLDDTDNYNGQPGSTHLICMKWNPSTKTIDPVHETNIDDIQNGLGPINSVITSNLEGEESYMTPLYARGDQLLLGMITDEGIDHDGENYGVRDERYGKYLSVAAIDNWITPRLRSRIYRNIISYQDYPDTKGIFFYVGETYDGITNITSYDNITYEFGSAPHFLTGDCNILELEPIINKWLNLPTLPNSSGIPASGYEAVGSGEVQKSQDTGRLGVYTTVGNKIIKEQESTHPVDSRDFSNRFKDTQ